MKILVLEDDQERVKHFRKKFIGHDVDYTDQADSAIQFIKNEVYDFIYLDHDLGGKQLEWDEDNCGMTVADYLEENPTSTEARIIIHSFNVAAVQRMKRALPAATYIPGVWTQKGLP